MEVPPAAAELAREHFSAKLAFETDCADVHRSFSSGTVDFVLIDVRGRDAYRKGHVPGAVNIPLHTLSERQMSEYPVGTRFVVYCAGPQCNGANKGALRLSTMGRPVKEMIGGVTGWLDDGYSLVKDEMPGGPSNPSSAR
jgi:rhodanese-related sulfurtransferase